MFIAYLAIYRKMTYAGIKSYVYGVRDWALNKNCKDPTKGSGRQQHRYQKLMRGIKRARTGKRRIRKPLKHKYLIKMLMHTYSMAPVDGACIRAALTLAFYGFFRVSEYTVVPRKAKFLRKKDVKICKNHLKVRLRESKTDQFSKSTVRVYFNNMVDCPGKHFQEYLQLSSHHRNSPVLMYQGAPLTAALFNSVFRNLVCRVGLNPNHFSSHSLRSGAASTAAESGVPSWLIQKLGRWKSGCYKIYIPDPRKAKQRAQLEMSQQ